MKVLIPDLPSTDDLIPFLRRIDAARQYSNDGPLVRELEQRLDGICVSSATVGLELSANAIFGTGREVTVPAFTFGATVTAIVRAGLTPILVDVDSDTWAAPMADVRVCAFGANVSVAGGGLVDAASAWGNGVTGNRVYSLHATKTLGIGEGGLVCGDPGLLEYVRHARNFGLKDGLIQYPGGTNAKLSEYHAAVGLAQLERLPAIVKKRQAIEARYRQNLEGVVEMQKRPIGSYAIFPVLVPERERVARELAAYDIETRSWYCPTLDQHPTTAKFHTSGTLKVTKMLSAQVLCLPLHSFLTEGDVDQVSDCLRTAVLHRRSLRASV